MTNKKSAQKCTKMHFFAQNTAESVHKSAQILHSLHFYCTFLEGVFFRGTFAASFKMKDKGINPQRGAPRKKSESFVGTARARMAIRQQDQSTKLSKKHYEKQ